MNIKDVTGVSNVRPADHAKGNAEAKSKASSEHATDATGTSDQLSLTSVGQYLAGVADQAAPVDRERVDAIRAALANGSYEIDAERVAEKILSLDRDLI